MKQLAAPLTALLALAIAAQAQEPKTPSTLTEKASYSMGFELGESMKKQGITIDPALYGQGIIDGIQGNKALLTEEAMKESSLEFRKNLQAQFKERMQKDGIENQAKAVSFLAENKKKPSVITTDSGLQYEVKKKGEGPSPTLSDVVQVHYTGTLLDGEVFDSSHKRGQPATFPLRGVIKGWQEGLQLMKAGASYRFFIPPELAYGTRGSPPRIGPNAALIFDVDLLEIKPQSAGRPGAR